MNDKSEKKRISSPMMTRFEKDSLIGTRAEQLARGVTPLVTFNPNIEKFVPYVIAKREVEKKLTSQIIRRHMPDGTFEDWHITELIQTK